MGHKFAELMFTEKVKALQEADGSRASYARLEAGPDGNDMLGEREMAFISMRDSFYMATVGETGWPYVQHRGGPRGFVKLIAENTLAFADFAGNRQFVSVGNLTTDDRVSLFFMDYPNRARLKVLGRVGISDDTALKAEFGAPGQQQRVERVFRIKVAAFDWNCPKYITPRFTAEDIEKAVEPLHARIAELEAMLGAERRTGC